MVDDRPRRLMSLARNITLAEAVAGSLDADPLC